MPQTINPNVEISFDKGTIAGNYFDLSGNNVYVMLHYITYPDGKVVNLSKKKILVWSPLEAIRSIHSLN